MIKMFENSEMFYFTKLIFLHLEEEIKLYLLRYNKGLQEKFDISLINYQMHTIIIILYLMNPNLKEKNTINFLMN